MSIINTITGEGLERLAKASPAGRIVKRIEVEKALQTVGTDAYAMAKLRLGPRTEGFLMARPDAAATILAPHGFTAWALQYKDLGKKLVDNGFNFYAPRLPGHGFMTRDGMLTGERMIQSTDRAAYTRWLDLRYKEAASLGKPVYLLGQSGGSDLALAGAERYGVEKTFAMVPFLGPDQPLKHVTDALVFLDKLTFGLVGRIMDLIPRNKNTLADAADLTPHTNRSFGSALAMGLEGRNVQAISGRLQIVTTEGDKAAGKAQVQDLLARIGDGPTRGWYHFPASEHVPHAMVSDLENPNTPAVRRLEDMAVAFFKDGTLVQQRPPTV
ncbi:MAG: hypothetical protein JWM80_2708 [Cyanobacteria bacterium RYN_339]|nr:hypothetical protein [Cyanobacteria bacterium RYN_339]